MFVTITHSVSTILAASRVGGGRTGVSHKTKTPPLFNEWARAQRIMVDTSTTSGERATKEKAIQDTMETVLEMRLDALRRRLYG